jgi:uncharacterized protein (DUF305 family)
MTRTLKAALAAIAFSLPTLALAQQQGQHGQHGQHSQPAKPAAGAPMPHHGGQHGGRGAAPAQAKLGPAEMAYQAINTRMHEQMDITFTGNPDVDFVRGMIPHHQGAVDMAKVVMAFGKDPEIRKLAETIVKAQEEEIAQLKAWLEKNAK